MSESPAGNAQRSGFVALVGWTNVGKSTLLNRLVGTKLAAVADVAQTTRRRIQGARTIPGRGQIVFVDTPGLHTPRHRMNRAMLESVRLALSGADAVVLVVDATRALGPGDRRAVEIVRGSPARPLVALNKVDRLRDKATLLPLIAALSGEYGFETVVPISALDGDGCDRLTELILEALPPGPALFDDDYLTDQSQRALVAEWIREKLVIGTRQELPHATAVTVERWHQREDGLIEIEATIFVERESQKRIVIGREGRLLKEVGSAARLELEQHLGSRVFLHLWVRVRERWRDDEQMLKLLGLTD